MKKSELRQVIKEVVKEAINPSEQKQALNILNKIDDIKDYLSDTLKLAKKDISKGLRVGIGNIKSFKRLADEIKEYADKL